VLTELLNYYVQELNCLYCVVSGNKINIALLRKLNCWL